jgi:hypothetical protein
MMPPASGVYFFVHLENGKPQEKHDQYPFHDCKLQIRRDKILTRQFKKLTMKNDAAANRIL